MDILSVSAAASLPVEWSRESQVLPEGFSPDETVDMDGYAVDYGFTEIMGIEIVQGKSFIRGRIGEESCVINQTAVRNLNWENPIGKKLTINGEVKTVAGVAGDYHFKSLFLETISPAVFYLAPEEMNYLFLKYSPGADPEQITGFAEEKWKTVFPDIPFVQTTLVNAFDDVFQGDKTAEMTGMLGLLAVLLSCMGLFGLSSYSVERRVKEIGIRKVLGASVAGIVRMLNKEFIKLVVISNIIAVPSAYFMMKAINDLVYAYPVTMGAGLFVVTVAASLVIAFLTVSSQTTRAALAEPVDSLKFE
jgi:putative ABC transport system permease protein